MAKLGHKGPQLNELKTQAETVADITGQNIAPNNIDATGPITVEDANINLSNAFALTGRNFADTLDLVMMRRDTADKVVIDPDGFGVAITGSTTIALNFTVDTDTFHVDSTADEVGINTASPASALHALSAASTTVMTNESSVSNNSFINLKGSTGNTFIGHKASDFVVQTAASSFADKLVVENAGNVDIPLGGLKLNGGTDVLDEYEKGTWTPVMAGSSTAGSHTYSTQAGIYTRIGDTVIAAYSINISTKDGAMAGNIQITGLPFSAANHEGQAGTITLVNNIVFADQLVADVVGTTTTANLRKLTSGTSGTVASVVAADIGSTPRIAGVFVYQL